MCAAAAGVAACHAPGRICVTEVTVFKSCGSVRVTRSAARQSLHFAVHPCTQGARGGGGRVQGNYSSFFQQNATVAGLSV